MEKALQLNKDEIEQIIAEVDEDGDGQINFQEFYQMMKKKEKDKDEEERKAEKRRKKKEEKEGKSDPNDGPQEGGEDA